MSENKRLLWGGCDAVDLAHKYGTPLYVLSEEIIRDRCKEITSKFLKKWDNTRAYYASKAFLTMTMARLIQSEGLGLDLVSGGEIYTAYKAGFKMENTLLHGSAKSDSEIADALRCGVGRIVVDNISEIAQIVNAAKELGTRAKILIRTAPGVSANTHHAMQTAHHGGKFGVPIAELEEAVSLVLSYPQLELFGFHFHIGSMIYSHEQHTAASNILLKKMLQMKKNLNFETRELDVGGGFGVALSPNEPTPQIASFTDPIMEAITKGCSELGLDRPTVFIEPGRWIVSEAGITLYSVESVKNTEKTSWVNIDGSMADNPRHCLYDAEYHAVIADRIDTQPTKAFAVAGHCCETGDTLIESIGLPAPQRGDILAVYNTGAYTFSMASNYNRLPRPAVVLAFDGKSSIIVTRQTYDDILSGEKIPARIGVVSGSII